jgi:hypothetical protein
LSTFLKKKVTVVSVLAILLIGTLIIWNQLQYTTFMKLFSKQLDENTQVESLTIYLLDDSGLPWQSLKIEEGKQIEAILRDVTAIELKSVDDSPRYVRDYQIEMVVTNQVKTDDHASTSVIRFELNKNYLDDYQIISKSDHLNTIESLVADENLEWQILRSQ